jgi:hypothetical protein
MLTSTDPTWVISNAMYWSVIETNIGILAASIPSYKAIAKKYAPRLLGTSGISSNKRSGFKQMPVELRGNSVPGTGAPKSTFETNIKNGLGDNSSEEVLVMPNGQIGVKTDIVFRYEQNVEDGHGHGGRI